MIKQSNLAPADTQKDTFWKSGLVLVIGASFCILHSHTLDFLLAYKFEIDHITCFSKS